MGTAIGTLVSGHWYMDTATGALVCGHGMWTLVYGHWAVVRSLVYGHCIVVPDLSTLSMLTGHRLIASYRLRFWIIPQTLAGASAA